MITATRRYLEALTTALTSETGIDIRAGKHWRADIKKRVLEYNPQDLTQLPPEVAKGFILHELGHLKHTVDTGDTELEKSNPAMHAVYNAFEDIRMERQLVRDYGAFADSPLWQSRQSVIDGMDKQTGSTPADILRQTLSRAIVKAPAYYSTYGEQYRDYDEKTSPEAQAYIRRTRDRINLAVKQAKDAGSLSEVKRICDEQVYPIIKDLMDQIPPEEQQEMKRAEQEKTGKPDGFHPKGEPPKFQEIPPDSELEGMLYPYIMTLTRKLGDILKERKAVRLRGLHRSGKLLSKNAYRVTTDETRIFSRRNKPEKADYHFIFCIDQSGSMAHDNRYANTYIGGFLVDQVAKRLGFPASYVRFHDRAENMDSYPALRDFHSGENDEAGALELAYQRLDPKRDNIVIVLTDGALCTDIKPPLEKLKRADALVFAVGVGMDNDELKAYGHYINVPDVTRLSGALIGLLQRIIHR